MSGAWAGRVLVSPVLHGEEHLPGQGETRPLLFVGNHSRIGVYDLPWVLSELYLRGIRVRLPSFLHCASPAAVVAHAGGNCSRATWFASEVCVPVAFCQLESVLLILGPLSRGSKLLFQGIWRTVASMIGSSDDRLCVTCAGEGTGTQRPLVWAVGSLL